MPALSLDTFANTNPAFCSLILRFFVEGYMRGDANGLPLPHVLLPLPIVLSSDLNGLFAGTNATTGLLTWVGRHPEVTIDLRKRVGSSASYSREALLFGLTQRILGMNQNGRIVTESRGLVRRVTFNASDERNRFVKNARKFGRWIADVRSIETVFSCLGLNR
jgi:hypothetical protein